MNKIRIYHGSLEQVPVPEIRQSNRTLDYGCGFYTTTSLEQATDWVTRRKKDKKKPACGYVNVYEVDLDAVRAAHCLWFDNPTEEWVDFVYANRNDRNFTHDYDFVYGPVANDRVYAAFALSTLLHHSNSSHSSSQTRYHYESEHHPTEPPPPAPRQDYRPRAVLC